MAARTFLKIGNHPCLDFLNTQIIQDGQTVDLLASFDHLVAWLNEMGILSESTGRSVLLPLRLAGGAAVLEEARRMRAHLRDAMEKFNRRGRVPAAILDEINGLLARPTRTVALIDSGGKLRRSATWVFQEPADLLRPIAWFAADLFSRIDYAAVRKCENAACILYFHDTSKNHSRRWCSMEICGNRFKAAAYYRRKRKRKR